MTETITIRPAVPGDAAGLRALRIEALANHPIAFAADHAAAVADPLTVWEDLVNKLAKDQSGVLCVAALEDGSLIGMAGLGRGHWPKTKHGGVIWGVYVKPAWRGRRVAAGLIEACEAWARAEGMVTLKLGVVTTNTAAIQCYARCGFTVYGVDPRSNCWEGVFYDELLMVKEVG